MIFKRRLWIRIHLHCLLLGDNGKPMRSIEKEECETTITSRPFFKGHNLLMQHSRTRLSISAPETIPCSPSQSPASHVTCYMHVPNSPRHTTVPFSLLLYTDYIVYSFFCFWCPLSTPSLPISDVVKWRINRILIILRWLFLNFCMVTLFFGISFFFYILLLLLFYLLERRE